MVTGEQFYYLKRQTVPNFRSLGSVHYCITYASQVHSLPALYTFTQLAEAAAFISFTLERKLT